MLTLIVLVAIAPVSAHGEKVADIYSATKQAFREIHQANLVGNMIGPNLYSCYWPGAFNDGNDPLPGLSWVSMDFAYYEFLMSEAGYTPEQWSPLLAPFEREMLIAYERMRDEAADAEPDYDEFLLQYWERRNQLMINLVATLSAERDADQPALLWIGECGAGEDLYKFQSEPEGAQIMIIPRWNYLVCRHRDVDPDDPISCEDWRVMSDGSVNAVIGQYHYLVSWDDGQEHRGRIDISNPDYEATIVLTPNGPRYQ